MTRTSAKLFAFLLSIFSTVIIVDAQSLTMQKKTFTRADTLRGSLRPERTCYDVHYYHLDIAIDTAKKTVSGSNTIGFTVVEDFSTLQIDLFENMKIVNILYGGKELRYRREFNAVFVEFPDKMEMGSYGEIKVNYQGQPIIAKRPPWDGGFTWQTDNNGKPWIGVSCEGIGASLWWPCKDYLGDEPDSMRISCNVPTGLYCVANGNLERTGAPNRRHVYFSLVRVVPHQQLQRDAKHRRLCHHS
jgi:aminopeptidase N